MIFTPIASSTPTSPAVSPSAKGKVLQKDFRLVDSNGKENTAATELLQSEWFADFLSLCLDSIYWGPTLIQLGDIIRNNGPLRFDGVELVPRKHVIPEYGVIVRSPGDDWHGVYHIGKATLPTGVWKLASPETSACF